MNNSKILLFLLISISYNSYAFCQVQNTQYYIKLQHAQTAVSTLNNKVDSLNNKIKYLEIDLNRRINDSSKTIEYLNSLSNAFGPLFTILAIFIGIITLVLPILTYLFAIRPSQRALKELEQNIDNRLATYLKDSRNKSIDSAIKNLSTGNAEEKSQAISYLNYTHPEGLLKTQLFELFRILKKNPVGTIKYQLAFILSSRKNEYADEYFAGDQLYDDYSVKTAAFSYFSKIGFSYYKDSICKILSNSPNQQWDIQVLLSSLYQNRNDDIPHFLNSKEIVDTLNENTLIFVKQSFGDLIKQFKIEQRDFENSYLFEKANTTITK